MLHIADDDVSGLPESVLRLAGDVLTISPCADLRSYKKIVPAIASFPTLDVVVCDDDAYYPRDWLRHLVRARTGTSRIVVCHRAHEIRQNADGTLEPYDRWGYESAGWEPSPRTFPTGVGGVLYPAGLLQNEDLDPDLFLELCPTADDIWLFWMASRRGATFRCLNIYRDWLLWSGSQASSLWTANNVERGNDRQIAAMTGHFGLPPGLRPS